MGIRVCLYLCAAGVLTVALAGCGGTPVRALDSITLTPSTVVAGPGSVQFTATGHWSSAPLSTTPLDVSWGACQNDAPTMLVTVTSAGLATCQKGAQGTYSVFANHAPTAGPVCNALGVCGGGCQITGTATLTCP